MTLYDDDDFDPTHPDAYGQDDDEHFDDFDTDAMREREDDDWSDFADPGGRSALRAATADNPRNLPCPSCDAPNRLTPADVALGYQCDTCADRDEHGGY